MKKLLSVLSALLLTNVLFAAGANKMTMVTYFPVKYVAYSQVDVMKQMDVGLTSACQMNLGCTTDEGFNTGKSLRVNNLLKVAGGKLELNDAPAIVGTTAIMGSGNGTADFDFETNLRVANYKQGYTLQADNMYLSELNLFGYKFPACSGETMSWQKLKLKNKDEVYLVCGEAEKGEETCTPSKNGLAKYYETCSDGSTKITYTWNYSTCKYDASGYCPKESDDISCCVLQKHTYYYTWNEPQDSNPYACGHDLVTETETYYREEGAKDKYGAGHANLCPANANIGIHLRGENLGWNCLISSTDWRDPEYAGCNRGGKIEKLICQWDKNTDNTCTKNQITDLVISEP